MYNKYHNDGFEVVAFPANQFGCQAPGTSDEERQYAIKKFGFEFPVMDKIAVKKKPTPQCRFSTSIGYALDWFTQVLVLHVKHI